MAIISRAPCRLETPSGNTLTIRISPTALPASSPGRYLAPYEDYIDAMRSPSANGDELSARLHFLWCAYCHFWLAQENNRQAFLFDMQADFHPPNVSRARHLLLVHLPGHYQWAHPHRDDCFHHERASPLGFPLGSLMPTIGKVTGRIPPLLLPAICTTPLPLVRRSCFQEQLVNSIFTKRSKN